MEKKIVGVIIVGCLFLMSAFSTAIPVEQKEEKITTEEEYICPVMYLDPETIERWEKDYNTAEQAYIDPALKAEIQTTQDYSILDLLEYTPEERNQGYCGNCWAWPCTAILAMELNTQKGIKDRLSVQFINTCGEDYTSGIYQIECCGGGNIDMFANFYRNTNYALPWSNTMAHWHDGVRNNCRTDCSEIAKEPNYPIYDMRAQTIRTRNIPMEDAVENIKNVLHQEKGVYFSILYPDLENLDAFRNMWSAFGEEESYNLDYYVGNPYVEEEAVGHAVLIVGYHDVEGTEDDYWIVLNSWGTTNQRPNGLMAFDMWMNYSGKYSNYYGFGAGTLDVSFEYEPLAPEQPTITGPTKGKPDTEYTYEFTAVDPQGDEIYLYIDWGDGTTSWWDGPYASGETISENHTWDEKQEYIIRARARDLDRNEGQWASFEVSMSKHKAAWLPFFEWFNQYPLLYQLLEQWRFI